VQAPAYIAFDLLWGNGLDLRPSLRVRPQTLHRILPHGSPLICEAVSVEGRGRKLFEMMCAKRSRGDPLQSVWPIIMTIGRDG
jgi:ATP-dependent DNA ligase